MFVVSVDKPLGTELTFEGAAMSDVVPTKGKTAAEALRDVE